MDFQAPTSGGKLNVEMDFDSRRQQNQLSVFNPTTVGKKKKFKIDDFNCRQEKKLLIFISTAVGNKKNCQDWSRRASS